MPFCGKMIFCTLLGNFKIHKEDRSAKRNFSELPRKRTANGAPSQFTPGTTHENVKGLISEAFKAAAKQGKIKPQDLDGFVFDTGRIIGASNGKKVTKIKIHINADGKGLHAFPFN